METERDMHWRIENYVFKKIKEIEAILQEIREVVLYHKETKDE